MTNPFNTYFDLVGVINLERRPDRRELARAELARIGINHAWWPAVDRLDDGHAGCTASHRAIWRKVAEMGPDARVLIFEDDFKAITLRDLALAGFRPGSKVWDTFESVEGEAGEKFTRMLPSIPDDWDVLYLGGGYAAPPIARVNKHVVHCAGMLTTSSYAITGRFAKRLTEETDRAAAERGFADKPMDWHPGPVDRHLELFAATSKFYCLQPRLFYQRASKSDITGETNSYLFSMTDVRHEEMV